MEDKVTVKLTHPVKFGEQETVTEITINQLLGEHMMVLNAGSEPTIGQLLEMACKANADGYPMVVFKKLRAVDVLKVVKAVGDFLGDGQTTGDSVSGS